MRVLAGRERPRAPSTVTPGQRERSRGGLFPLQKHQVYPDAGVVQGNGLDSLCGQPCCPQQPGRAPALSSWAAPRGAQCSPGLGVDAAGVLIGVMSYRRLCTSVCSCTFQSHSHCISINIFPGFSLSFD